MTDKTPTIGSIYKLNRKSMIMIGYSVMLGGCVVFFGFILEFMMQTLGEPIGLGAFVTLLSILFGTLSRNE